MELPRDYNAAVDLVGRNLAAGRGSKVAYVDDTETCTYAQLAERVDRAANLLRSMDLRRALHQVQRAQRVHPARLPPSQPRRRGRRRLLPLRQPLRARHAAARRPRCRILAPPSHGTRDPSRRRRNECPRTLAAARPVTLS